MYAIGTIGVEAVSRGLGWLDFRTNRDHSTWKVSQSTKAVLTEELAWAAPEAQVDGELAVAVVGGAGARRGR